MPHHALETIPHGAANLVDQDGGKPCEAMMSMTKSMHMQRDTKGEACMCIGRLDIYDTKVITK